MSGQTEADYIMVDDDAPSGGSEPSELQSAETAKKHKPSGSPSRSSSIDFSFLRDSVLPAIPDEEVVEIGSSTWEIKDYKSLTEDKERGPVFTVGGYDFNVLLFPKGNTNNNLAMYLEPVPKRHLDETTGEMVPDDPNWYVCAQFTLIISNPKDPHNCIANTSHQRFSKHASDWGFSNFTELRSLYQPRKDAAALLLDDHLNITAYVKVLKDTTGVLWHNFLDYDSKKETGFVGFNNQGATCYLNSLLQSYFFTKAFRKAVYQIPTADETSSETVPLALQKVFYELQASDEAVDTAGLTKSFGWDSNDAFLQHDVQELNRVLMDRLEARMKGTPVEDMLSKTFVGKMKSYIKCIHVDYESSRIEDFWDIQLNVKNLSNLNQSFQDYIEVELMDGENQYAAQDFGLQDAKKGVIFTEFPNVLHLQLKRFEFNFEIEDLCKVNDRYEFPESIDLSPFLERDGRDAEPCIYDLHGVLVHAGEITNGHYYAMIKPDKSDKWFRFDDDRVWRVTKREVFEENFGHQLIPQSELAKMTKAQYQNYIQRRHTSAYMLVYIKRTEVEKILEDVPDKCVPAHVRDVVTNEIEERKLKRKEEEERHLYIDINFYTDDLFKKYQGFDLGADERLAQPGLYTQEFYPFKIKALRASKFSEIYPIIKEKTGTDVETATLWSMSYRRNHTLRPNSKLKGISDLTVEEIYEKGFSKKNACINIWIEEPSKELLQSVPATIQPIEKIDASHEDNLIEYTKIVLFLKYFDVESQTLKGISHLFVTEDDTIESIVPAIKNILNIDEYELEFFEEISNGSIERLNPQLTFFKSELGNGDIITVQKAIPRDGDLLSESYKDIIPFYSTAEDFYMFLGARRHINVRRLTTHSKDDEFVVVESDEEESVEESSFDMWISSHALYDELAQRIGKKINKDFRFLRVYVNYNGHRAVMRSNMTVGNLIPRSLWHNEIPQFEYELLSTPLAELEKMTSVTIHWLPSGYCHYVDHAILINGEATIQELINKLQTKIGFSDDDKDSVVIWTNYENKFTQLVTPKMDLDAIEGQTDIFGAILPEESKLLKEQYYNIDEEEPQDVSDQPLPILVPILQFFKDPRNMHGISFIFAVYPGEKLSETRDRMQKKMGLGQKEFSKVSFCIWDPEKKAPLYQIDDDLVLFDELKSRHYLCLDLPDRTSRTGAPQHAGISIR